MKGLHTKVSEQLEVELQVVSPELLLFLFESFKMTL